MRIRRNAFASVAVVPTLVAAALAVALVALIGSAQAAPSNKVYDATVRVKNGTTPSATSAVLTLTLTNNNRSKQTIGSANFTAPVGVTPSSPSINPVRTGWGAGLLPGGIVTFRSTSNALNSGESVSADVTVTIAGTCADASWLSQVKQSNDFSGTGNDFSVGVDTNLRPLGSLSIADIGTEVDDPDTPEDENLFVPQIEVSVQEPLAIAAKDICGAAYANYGRSSTFGASATLAPKDASPPRLVNADISSIAWTSGTGAGAGTGTATLEPVDVETGDHLVVSDQFTTITDESNEFDVVEKICTSFEDTCHWDNGNNQIHVDAPSPPLGASLGIGFIGDEGFSCNNDDAAIGSTLIYINPRDYEPGEAQSVTLTYDKTIPGTSGPTSAFSVCISKDNGLSWTGPIPECASDPPSTSDPTPCVQDRGRSNGNLFIVLFFDPTVDPVGGLT